MRSNVSLRMLLQHLLWYDLEYHKFLSMRKNIIIAVMLCSLVTLTSHAETNEQFTPGGGPILRIFGNYHSGLTEADNSSLFEIKRAFLGYGYQMAPNFFAEVKIDIGSPQEESRYALVKRYAYLRNAYVRYKTDRLQVNFGIIGMTHFKPQEKFWGYRYIRKSFADEFKFGKSVDLGVNATYKAASWADLDVSIVNGEGYSQLQTDNNFEYCFGTTLKPAKNITARLYMNYGPSEGTAKKVYAAFLGYQMNDKLSIGADYNLLHNYKYQDNRNQWGYSVYSTYKIKSSWKVFARYDVLRSNIVSEIPWNLAKDGSALLAGIEKKLNDNLKVSLNYTDWVAYAENIGNKAYIYFNVELNIK